METNVYVTDADMMAHIEHTWDMTVEDGRVYLMCDCGDIITSCDVPYWYHQVSGHWISDDEEVTINDEMEEE